MPPNNDIKELRWSSLRNILTSPLHYHTPPSFSERASTIGTAVHAAVLEPTRRIMQYDAPRRGAAWHDFAEANTDAVILTPGDYERVMGAANAVHSRLPWLMHRNVRREWELPRWNERGHDCGGRVDAFDVDRNALIELKTCSSVRRQAIATATAQYLYHAQLAWYAGGIKADSALPSAYEIIFVETSRPYDVAWVDVTGAVNEDGFEQVARALNLFEECTASNTWPGQWGIQDEPWVLRLPDWYGGRSEPIELDGEVIA